MEHLRSVVVLEENPCPQGPIFKSLSLPLSLKSLTTTLQLRLMHFSINTQIRLLYFFHNIICSILKITQSITEKL